VWMSVCNPGCVYVVGCWRLEVGDLRLEIGDGRSKMGDGRWEAWKWAGPCGRGARVGGFDSQQVK
jgi:hypothetical protein